MTQEWVQLDFLELARKWLESDSKVAKMTPNYLLKNDSVVTAESLSSRFLANSEKSCWSPF